VKTSTGKPTKYEQKRIEAMLRLGCVVSAQLGLWSVAEVHHIVEGNRRLGHWYTLPLSPGFHRGVWSPEQIEVIPPDLRTAISSGSKLFEKHYGTERELWMKVQARLKLPAVWPITKILPRRSGGNRDVFFPPMGSVSSLAELPVGEVSLPPLLPADAGQGDGERVGSEAVSGDTP
jgi:hypothetical protein